MAASTVGSDLVVDPELVPVYPVVRLELRPEAGGETVQGLMDGEPVLSGPAEAVRPALARAASDRARERPCRAIRVVLAGEGWESEAGVVTGDGDLVTAAPTNQPAARGRGRLVALVAGGAVLVGAAGVAAVAVSSGLGWNRPAVVATPTPTATSTQLPVQAPPGWGSVAAWSRPVGAGMSSPTITTYRSGARSLVVLPAAGSGSVSAVDERTGVPVWSGSLDGSAMGTSLAGGPVLASMGTRAVIAGWSSTTLTVWDATSGDRLGAWPLGAATRGFVSDGRLIVAGQSQHVGVLTPSGLSWRVLAAGATPVAATPAGEVVAAASGRVWVTASDQVAGEGAALPGPAHLSWVGPVGMSRGLLVVAYSASAGDGTVVLRAFRAPAAGPTAVKGAAAWVPVWTSKPIAGGGVQSSAVTSLPLLVSTSGTWGLIGSSWVDLRTGAVQALPSDWQTSTVGSVTAFGSTGGRVARVSPSGVVTVAPAASSGGGMVTAPAAVTESGMALVVASDGQASSLYAIPALTPPAASPVASSAPAARGGAR